jgi:endonuclease-3
LLLSSQTKDEATSAAVSRLLKSPYGLTIKGVQDIPSPELTSLLYGIGFHNKKSVYMKNIADILSEKYDSDIPRTFQEIVSLPGIGPKMGHLIMQVRTKLSINSIDTCFHFHSSHF